MRRLLALPLVVVAACADPDLGNLSESQGATVYTTVTAELRNLHSMVLASRPLPPRYTYSCASGTIELTMSQDAMMEPTRLKHDLDGCAMQDLKTDGHIEYGSLAVCDDGATGRFSFTFGGLVDVSGPMSGFCYIEVHTTCDGAISGHICGFPADEVLGL